jgi:hypothetical protein
VFYRESIDGNRKLVDGNRKPLAALLWPHAARNPAYLRDDRVSGTGAMLGGRAPVPEAIRPSEAMRARTDLLREVIAADDDNQRLRSP